MWPFIFTKSSHRWLATQDFATATRWNTNQSPLQRTETYSFWQNLAKIWPLGCGEALRPGINEWAVCGHVLVTGVGGVWCWCVFEGPLRSLAQHPQQLINTLSPKHKTSAYWERLFTRNRRGRLSRELEAAYAQPQGKTCLCARCEERHTCERTWPGSDTGAVRAH